MYQELVNRGRDGWVLGRNVHGIRRDNHLEVRELVPSPTNPGSFRSVGNVIGKFYLKDRGTDGVLLWSNEEESVLIIDVED